MSGVKVNKIRWFESGKRHKQFKGQADKRQIKEVCVQKKEFVPFSQIYEQYKPMSFSLIVKE